MQSNDSVPFQDDFQDTIIWEQIHALEQRHREQDKQMALILARMSEYELSLTLAKESLERSLERDLRALNNLRSEHSHNQRRVHDDIANLSRHVASLIKNRRLSALFDPYLLSLSKRIIHLEEGLTFMSSGTEGLRMLLANSNHSIPQIADASVVGSADSAEFHGKILMDEQLNVDAFSLSTHAHTGLSTMSRADSSALFESEDDDADDQ